MVPAAPSGPQPKKGRTNGPMDQWTDRPMDIPSYRDARTHLKMMVTKDEVDIWVLGVTRMKYAFWNKSEIGSYPLLIPKSHYQRERL